MKVMYHKLKCEKIVIEVIEEKQKKFKNVSCTFYFKKKLYSVLGIP